jgi:serine protease Do
LKRQNVLIVVVALLSFLVGEWYIVSQQNKALNSGSQPNPTTFGTTATGGSISVADIVESVGPAVVYIESSVSGSDSLNNFRIFGQKSSVQPAQATGSGFIIDPNGYILTNQHVVNGVESIKVTLKGQEAPFDAAVVGQDYDLDLAILKINANSLPTIAMGDSDTMRPGDAVIAIGNPLGLDHTVTTGVVSAKGRPITIQDRNYKNLIQTDAAINPGNSGGPLINMQGQVIAINTAISADAQGIGFAIPINTAKSIMQELINTGKVVRPYLGISMTDMSAEISTMLKVSPNTKGAVIVNVLANSPAGEAGVAYMDILVSIDGNPIADGTQVQDYIAKQKVGQTVQLGIMRDHQTINIPVTLKEKP